MRRKQRVWSEIAADPQTCVLFTGSVSSRGYGLVWRDGRTRLAHRVAWLDAGRDLPEGMELHHTCNVRACVNVGHLQLLTPPEHRLIENGKPTCPACGEPRELRVRPTGTRYHHCVSCTSAYRREWARRRKAG